MLQHLHIKNYAIIDDLEIDLSNGLNAITGETGTGKSIVIGALSLILGERADNAILLNKEQKCIVEGTFISASKPVQAFLRHNDIEEGADIMVRREIGSNGHL